jgi:hypothetical protein
MPLEGATRAPLIAAGVSQVKGMEKAKSLRKKDVQVKVWQLLI